MKELKNIDPASLNTIANIIAAKKYGYNYSYNINEPLTALSERIFHEKSIALFESKDRKKIYDLENIFGEYISKISKDYFSKREVDDELTLLSRAHEIEKGFLNPSNVHEAEEGGTKIGLKNSRSPDFFFHRLPIPQSEIIAYAPQADYINRVVHEKVVGLSLVFLTKKITLAGQDKVLLSLLIQRPHKIGVYYLSFAFLFNWEEHGDMLSRPARLFLKILDYYAWDITFDGVTKKFWDHRYVRSLSNLQHEFTLPYRTKTEISESLFLLIWTKCQFTDEIAYFFALNQHKYFNDLKKNMI